MNRTPDKSVGLSDEQRMLVQMRDTLYEGSWDDFVADLRARATGRAHVFDTVPMSSQMKATIDHHLTLIDDMRTWEARKGRPLNLAE